MTFPHNASLADLREARADLIQKMASDLIRFDALANEADSIRSLYGAGYRSMDVMMLVPEARMMAFQEVVAREMSES